MGQWDTGPRLHPDWKRKKPRAAMAFIGPGLYHMATGFLLCFLARVKACPSIFRPAQAGAQLPAMGHV